MPTSSLNEKNISIMSNFSGSKKVYVEGSRPDIKVPMREIELSQRQGHLVRKKTHLSVSMTQADLTQTRIIQLTLRKDCQHFVKNGFASGAMLKLMNRVK